MIEGIIGMLIGIGVIVFLMWMHQRSLPDQYQENSDEILGLLYRHKSLEQLPQDTKSKKAH